MGGDAMRGKKAFAALAVAALWALGAPSASASQHDRGSDRDVGAVIPGGSTDGVNPVYHPEYFGSPANAACFERFKTYDWVSGTYLGHDGRRHPCRVR
jgi:hypothetical protein